MKPKVIFPLSIFVLAVICVVLLYLSGFKPQVLMFNSDGLYLPVLFEDLFGKGGRLNDWYLTPAPYFFPDYLMFAISYFFADGAYYQLLVFLVIQLVMSFGVVAALVAQVNKRWGWWEALLVLLLWIFFGVISEAHQAFSYIFISAFHYGAFICSVVFLALVLLYFKLGGGGFKIVFFISILSFLVALSDNLFLVQALAPFFAVSIFLGLIDRSCSIKYFAFVLLPVASGVLGSIAYKFLVFNETRPSVTLGFDGVYEGFLSVVSILNEYVDVNPFWGAIFFLYVVLSFWIVLSFVLRRGAAEEGREVVWLVLFSFASILSSCLAVAVMTGITVAPRYLMPVFFWPPLVVILIVAGFFKENFYFGGALISVVIASCLCVSASRSLGKKEVSVGYYPEEISCIDGFLAAEGLYYGIAQYWDAKRIQAFSKNEITLAQHLEGLEEMRWITSGQYFRDKYDFAIISNDFGSPYKISVDKLVRVSGEPVRTYHCGSKDVLVFGRSNLRVRKIVSPGDSYVWQACELPTIIGTIAPGCVIEKKNLSDAGYLTFGPYESLPAGDYHFEFEYSSTGGGEDVSGKWDTVIARPQEAKVVREGLVMGTNNQVGKLSGDFSVSHNFDQGKIEIRFYASQDSALSVKSLRLARVK